jgi:DNA-binding Xre family transcriptional regulator
MLTKNEMGNNFTLSVKAKGWKMQDLAERWGITPRQISRIAEAPKQIHWDALDGLPDKD